MTKHYLVYLFVLFYLQTLMFLSLHIKLIEVLKMPYVLIAMKY